MDLKMLTKAELLTLAESKGIELNRFATKAEMIATIKAADDTTSAEKEAEEAQTQKEVNTKSKARKSQSSQPRRSRGPRGAAFTPSGPTLKHGNVTVKGEDKFKKAISPEEQKKLDMVASMDKNAQKILKAKVVGFRFVEHNEKTHLIMLADWNGDTVMFRDFDFFPQLTPNHTVPVSTILSWAQKRKGLEFEFRVKQFDQTYPVEKFIMGSRVQAMNKIRNKFWFARSSQKDDEGNNLMYLREGLIVDAKVVAIIPSGIFVEVFGVECFISSAELFRVFVHNVSDRFEINQIIKIMILTIERNGYNVSFTASHVRALPDNRIEFFNSYMTGDNLKATVVNIYQNEKTGAYKIMTNVNDKINVLCDMHKGVDRTPLPGMDVDIVIKGKDPNSMKVWGEVTHIYEKF